jgi:cell division protein FtsX
MSSGAKAAVREQAIVSGIVNAVLSAAIFLLVFGLARRALTIGAPDQFALDFLPQGAILGFMSAFLPALVVRNKLRQGALNITTSRISTVGSIALRAVLLSLLSVAVAAVAMWLTQRFGANAVEWLEALVIKIVFGVVLGVIVTRIAVRAVLR